ncbi:uncharacterized protein LOC102807656 [Saccoglossus kowalevskii]|uniref:Uncharacterized protein LOC102807656 n=1 Tax=Saccoglossus kowalevskii TaxID=10224 RepID=A0ABM0MD89_SACKO|nr:PREDICTED: uncharacterized protein LOC102807656 [Saccoglossus kowalevskii]
MWFILILSICLVSRGLSQESPPGATKYIGVTYNGLYGNPEGDYSVNGGVDPGLNLVNVVLAATFNDGKTWNGYNVPDQQEFNFADTCTTVSTIEQFWAGLSYYNFRLTDHSRQDIDVNHLEGREFTLSNGYQYYENKTNGDGFVYYDEKDECNHGTARYMLENVESGMYPLSDPFVSAACSLPESYDTAVYMDFLDTWGTDVVTEVSLGKKTTNRFESGRIDFVAYVADEYPDEAVPNGAYEGYRDSVRVTMETYVTTSTTTGGVLVSTLNTGDSELSEPIQTKVISIDEVFDVKFWTLFDDYVLRGVCALANTTELESRQTNVLAALKNYADFKNAATPETTIVVTPVTWPVGKYGFPETDYSFDGCPISPDFVYATGWINQDTADTSGNNSHSDPFNLNQPESVIGSNVECNYCMKLDEEPNREEWKWLKGEYCMYRKNICPPGFLSGYVLWDDEDRSNQNAFTGELPDGVYNEDTLTYFCCREDAPTPDHVLYLPTDRPFVLFKRTTNCPNVFGMSVSHQWFNWGQEQTVGGGKSHLSGAHPYNDGVGEDIRLHYCYYF